MMSLELSESAQLERSSSLRYLSLVSGMVRIGIIHIDEVDKLARRGGGGDGGSWGGRDVGGEGVQQGKPDQTFICCRTR